MKPGIDHRPETVEIDLDRDIYSVCHLHLSSNSKTYLCGKPIMGRQHKAKNFLPPGVPFPPCLEHTKRCEICEAEHMK